MNSNQYNAADFDRKPTVPGVPGFTVTPKCVTVKPTSNPLLVYFVFREWFLL